MSTKTIKIICIVVVFVVVILATISWYSHTETVTGVVTSKWVESHTSCSNNSKSKGSSCTTTPVFLFQIQDGRVFDLPLGTLDFDRIQTGDKVSFVARGYDLKIGGWRLNQPSVFGFDSITHSISK